MHFKVIEKNPFLPTVQAVIHSEGGAAINCFPRINTSKHRVNSADIAHNKTAASAQATGIATKNNGASDTVPGPAPHANKTRRYFWNTRCVVFAEETGWPREKSRGEWKIFINVFLEKNVADTEYNGKIARYNGVFLP